jgi:hypothetical protein
VGARALVGEEDVREGSSRGEGEAARRWRARGEGYIRVSISIRIRRGSEGARDRQGWMDRGRE